MKIETTMQSQSRRASHITVNVGRKGGITVDKDFNKKSKNPIANGPVATSIENFESRLGAAEKKVATNTQAITRLPTGNYPKMTVGFADNLVGRGESTSEEFLYRQTAGRTSILDGTARIAKIKGNSRVYNQLFKNFEPAAQLVDNTSYYTLKFNAQWERFRAVMPFIHNHVYSIVFDVQYVSGDGDIRVNVGHSSYGTLSRQAHTITKFSGYFRYHIIDRFIDQAPSDSTDPYELYFMQYGESSEPTIYNIKKGIEVHDLTQMFGAGNEPTTSEDFYYRIPSGVNLSAYNKGEIINLNTNGIFTTGFNMWDEQWELGVYDKDSGQKIPSSSAIRCVNAIKVSELNDYYLYCPEKENVYLTVLFYDRFGDYIGNRAALNGTIITTPELSAYMKFYCSAEYGTTYNNDICFNLPHTGYKNGTYEPYEEFYRELPVIKKYFPDGMKKAGSAFDSIEWNSGKQKWVAVQRVCTVDLGALSGAYVPEFGHYQINISNKKPAITNGTASNLICSKYLTAPVTYASIASKPSYSVMESISEGRTLIYVVDPTCTDASSYLSALNGVMLNYELAEPIITVIEESDINFDYEVRDFGTEEALSDVPSAAFRADIIYQFNAVDTIRKNSQDIDSLEEDSKPYYFSYYTDEALFDTDNVYEALKEDAQRLYNNVAKGRNIRVNIWHGEGEIQGEAIGTIGGDPQAGAPRYVTIVFFWGAYIFRFTYFFYEEEDEEYCELNVMSRTL